MNALLLITDLEEADLEDLYADIKVYQGGECVQLVYGAPLIKVPTRKAVCYDFGCEMAKCLEQILGEEE